MNPKGWIVGGALLLCVFMPGLALAQTPTPAVTPTPLWEIATPGASAPDTRGQAKAYNERGLAYYKAGDSQRALADYDQAITLDPELALAYNNRGNVYDDQGDTERALADYDRAIEIDPQNADSHLNRGVVHNKLGDAKRAAEDLEAAFKLAPDASWAAQAKGWLEALKS